MGVGCAWADPWTVVWQLDQRPKTNVHLKSASSSCSNAWMVVSYFSCLVLLWWQFARLGHAVGVVGQQLASSRRGAPHP